MANEVKAVPVLRPARPEDLPEVLALLRESRLPVQGVAEAIGGFAVAEAEGRIIGVAGLERYGRDGLLRSVAVSEAWRGQGLGSALTDEVLRRAAGTGTEVVYLLTATAADFFPRHGFLPIPREQVAQSVRASAEFAELCPASAVVMRREMDAAPARTP